MRECKGGNEWGKSVLLERNSLNKSKETVNEKKKRQIPGQSNPDYKRSKKSRPVDFRPKGKSLKNDHWGSGGRGNKAVLRGSKSIPGV